MAKPFDPLKFLDLAYALGAQAESEAHLRAAVGRAYYALLLTARERLGIPPGHRRVHKKTLRAVRRVDKATGDKLGRLQGLRDEADYHLTPSRPEYGNWGQNWARAKGWVQDLLPKIRSI